MEVKKIFYTSHFRRALQRIPRELIGIVKEREQLFRADCFDRRLKTHKLKGKLDGFWSFSLTHAHRVFFVFEGNDAVTFIDVGDHTIYR